MTTPVAGGWTPHDGGPNPAPGKRVDVRFADGDVLLNALSDGLVRWHDIIIAYRIVPDVPALTDGEGEHDPITIMEERLYRLEAQASAYKGRVVQLEAALNAVLDTSGARKAYHAIEYGDAVAKAEALLNGADR